MTDLDEALPTLSPDDVVPGQITAFDVGVDEQAATVLTQVFTALRN